MTQQPDGAGDDRHSASPSARLPHEGSVEEPVTEIDRAEEMAEAAGADPTLEEVAAYQEAQGEGTTGAG